MKLIQNKVAIAGFSLALLCGAPSVWASPLEATQTAPAVRVTGTVTDESGEPLIGANVMVKGETKGANTDLDGRFALDVNPGQTLVVSYIGYLPQEFVVKDAGNLDIVLHENATVLDEVVAIGYGVQKKKLVTGATIQVKGDDVAKMNTSNALTALQSTSPGVQITQSSSQPGKGFKVSIRGVGTIGESSPLLIIDGVNSGTANDGLNGLNPNDIESIDILKDAASAAIYGARAANGVILVTTKQGKAGKTTVSYDGYVGWSNAYKVPGTLGAKQYMQIVNETYMNTYGSAPNWPTLVPQSVLDKVNNGWDGTDWFDLYKNKNAVQTSHAVTVTGGNDNGHFSMSVNYSKNNGIMGGDNASDYKRYGGRINSEYYLLKAKDGRNIITVGENLSYWYHSSHDLAESNGYWNIMQGAYTASPLVPAYNDNGQISTYANDGAGFSTMIYNNPYHAFLAGQYNSLNRSRDFGVGATFYWVIEPIKGLRYRGQVNTGYSASNYRAVSNPFSASSTSASNNYGLSQSQNQGSSLTFENTITYILPQFGKNNIDLMIGQSLEQSNWSTGMSVSASDSEDIINSLVLNGWDYAILSNFQNITGYSGYDNPRQGNISSFFGRVNYNFDEKYLATVTVRRDGSNNFAKGHRWGTFPSASIGWVVTGENFMESVHDVMDYLKIRASWGQNGNCNVGNFYYISNIGFSPTDYADYGYKFSSDMLSTVNSSYTPGAYFKNVPNNDITWEKSEQWNIGLDSRFINGRLNFNFDWYRKTTKDWLVQATLNDVLGYEIPAYINGGDVRNQGVEIALGWNDRVGNDFIYHANVNAAYNKNEVTRIANANGRIEGQTNAIFQNSSYVSMVEVGHPIAYFNGMDYEGIWQTQAEIDAARQAGKAMLDNAQPGDPIWIDYNNDGVITLDGDRHEIGDPNPDWTLGINLGFEWKGLDFSAAGSGAFGMQVMQCYRTALLANPFVEYTTDALDRWHGAGTSNTRPRLVVGGEANQWVSTLYMQNADYFKLQNVTLGYDFNRLWKKSPFRQLRLYVQAQNLCTITKYTGVDPEVGSGGGKDSWARGIDVGLYPSTRTFLVGASIKF